MIDTLELDDCIQRFAKEVNILAVWLLGSAVSKRMRANSDVDVAVFFKDIARHLKQDGYLISDLKTVLGRPVDLGKLDTRNLIYSHEAISKGQLIYNRESVQTNQFVERVLALYFDLKQDRKVVEDAYCA